MKSLFVSVALLLAWSGNELRGTAPLPGPMHAEFARRAEAVARHGGPPELRAELVAFQDFDRLTHPEYLREEARAASDEASARLAAAIEEVTGYLMERVHYRAACARYNVPFRSPQPAPEPATLAQVEHAFRTALGSCFDVRCGTGKVPFERAFLDYSLGKLAVVVEPLESNEVHGAPNGIHHFAFQEAALLFMENDLSPDYWNELLPALEVGMRAFVETHWDGAERTCKNYAGGNATLRVTDALPTLEGFDALVAFALADENKYRLSTDGPVEVLVYSALYVENATPGTYSKVDLSGPELAELKITQLVEELDKTYVTLSEDPDEQVKLVTEHIQAASEKVEFDGKIDWDEYESSRQTSNGWEATDGLAVVLPVHPVFTDDSSLDPKKNYFLGLEQEF